MLQVKVENKLGSNCSGTDGQANRVLTLSNDYLTSDDLFVVFLGGFSQAINVDYTISHLATDSQLTFLNSVHDSSPIQVVYSVNIENIGSYIYCAEDDVYNRTGLSSSEINLTTNYNIIQDSEAEIEALTGRKFTSANAVTELLSGGKKDIFENLTTKITLKNFPIQSITSFQILDSDGTSNKTYDTLSSAEISAGTYFSSDYSLELQVDPLTNTASPFGSIKLISSVFPTGVNNIKVAYTYGYATVPKEIRACVSCLAGIRAWVSFLGGSYNYLNSYSIPQQSANKGDLYERGMKIINQLTEEANRLLDRIGRRPRVFFTTTGQDR